MEQRQLGKTDLKASVMGFGGAEIGFGGASPSEATEIISRVLDSGVNFIDTAAAYLTSEELLGHALEGRRDKVVLATKCGAIDGFSRSDWSKAGILKTVQQSLKNLRTDHVDVLFLHSCGELEMSWGEALQGVEEARKAGYARYIGYSGDGPAALWAVNSGRFDVIETSLSIVDQEALDFHLPVANRSKIGVVTKRSIGNAVWRYEKKPENDYHLEYWKRWNELKFDFKDRDSSEIASIALRFTLAQPGVHCAIVGTTKPSRHQENVELLSEGALESREIDSIRAAWKATADQYWVGQI